MKFFTMNKSEENQINDGVLYFSQRIDEMLKHSTLHIYKAPLLNTFLLAREYLITAKNVSFKVINESHLQYVYEEFLESFNNDIILKNNLSLDFRNAIVQKLQSSNERDRTKIMHYIMHKIGDYNSWCKEYLLSVVTQEKEKKKIEKALRCYIPGLIEGGYSAEYIYYHNKTTFNQKGKYDTELLSEFLNRFDFKKRKYCVYVALHNSVCEIKDILKKRLKVIFDFDKSEAQGYKYYAKKYILAKLEIEALDKQQAAETAYHYLDLFYSFYRFMNDDGKKWYLNKCMVKLSDDDYAFVDFKIHKYNYPQYKELNTSELSSLIITSLLTRARCSFEQIEKVVSLHNIALEDTDISNGFLNFWSILEVLFVRDNDCAKIKEIEKKLIPILQKEYLSSLFDDLNNNLKDNLSIEQYENILNSIDGEDNKRKIAKLVIFDDYDEVRKELYIYLSSFPLLRSRVSQLNMLCKKKNILKAELDRFTRRVTRHLIRLYRTRNSIIHSGDITDNLIFLGEHLHSYIDACVWEILLKLTSDEQLCSIENVVTDEIFEIEKTTRILSSDEKFKDEDLFIFCSSEKRITIDEGLCE